MYAIQLQVMPFFKTVYSSVGAFKFIFLKQKSKSQCFVESILSVIVRLFCIALYTQIVNASSISGKATFFSRLKSACNELRSMTSHLFLFFKILLIIPLLTSY